ncbi:alpha/beta-Hydrolases superfamily protein [Thalictrum thalictroides]|uniref:Alpha/beta-Hydrolases superfamily protein n=1 Tax=Thalictrum thalictroides TaxID=46969 RepID=A0A7J6VAA8_THATH|nr:alpha/beta-Hydrolases superfamily protein [Thalictrum thalictroides]
MSTSSWFSLTSFFESYLCRTFTSSGLLLQTIEIDSQTTISFWGPNHSIQKPNLVLLHGFGPRSVWQWGPQVKSLAPHFNLYVPDLIFFGNSTTKSKERSTVFQAASIGKLLEKLQVNNFSVLGTSYGGFVAYHMASLFKDRVEKVIIASSALNKKASDHQVLLEKANVEKAEDVMLPKNPNQLRNLMRLTAFHQPPYLPDFLLNDFIKFAFIQNLEEKKQLMMEFDFGDDLHLQISPLQQEVLIVWGECDKIFPFKKALELKELLGDESRLEVIKNTSHMPHGEDSKKFNDIVMKFLSAAGSQTDSITPKTIGSRLSSSMYLIFSALHLK